MRQYHTRFLAQNRKRITLYDHNHIVQGTWRQGEWRRPGLSGTSAARALPRQLLVPDPVRLHRVLAQTLLLVLLVLLEVARVPHHLGLALEGEHVGGDTV